MYFSGVYCTSLWVTLCTSPFRAYWDLSLVIHPEVKGEERVIKDSLGGLTSQAGMGALLLLAKVGQQNLEVTCSHFYCDLSMCSPSNFQDPIPAQSMPSLE